MEFRILDRTLRIHCDEEPVRGWIERAYAAMSATDGTAHDEALEISVVRDDDGYQVIPPREAALRTDDPGACLATLEDVLAVELQLSRPDLFFVHAGVVQRHDQAVLVCGQSGAGKSWLTWALTCRGLGYSSDELAPIAGPEAMVSPFPRALHLKAEPAAPYGFPQDAFDTGHSRCVPAEVVAGGVATAPAPPSTIFFLQRSDGSSAPRVEPLSDAQSVARLASNTLNLLAHPDYGVDRASAIVGGCACFELDAGDLDATCDLVLSILDSRDGGPKEGP